MKELWNKLKTVTNPKLMYKVNIGLAFMDIGIALSCWQLGLDPAFINLFLMTTVCFFVAAAANMFIHENLI